jgi:hypothetical protein
MFRSKGKNKEDLIVVPPPINITLKSFALCRLSMAAMIFGTIFESVLQ